MTAKLRSPVEQAMLAAGCDMRRLARAIDRSIGHTRQLVRGTVSWPLMLADRARRVLGNRLEDYLWKRPGAVARKRGRRPGNHAKARGAAACRGWGTASAGAAGEER